MGTTLSVQRLIRKQITFIKTEWVDVKPALAKDSKEYKELRSGEVRASKKIGFDDEAPKGGLAGTKWADEKGSRLHFKDDSIIVFTWGNVDYKGTWSPAAKGFNADVDLGDNGQGGVLRQQMEGTISDDQLQFRFRRKSAGQWLDWGTVFRSQN